MAPADRPRVCRRHRPRAVVPARHPARAGRGALLCGLDIAVWTTIDLNWFVALDVPGEYGWARALIWGGAALVFAGLVFGDFRFDHGIARQISRIGDASYALYLLHPFVFLGAKVILPMLPLGAGSLWPLTLLVVALSVLATLAFHRFAEKPALRWLQGIGSGPVGGRAAAPAPVNS